MGQGTPQEVFGEGEVFDRNMAQWEDSLYRLQTGGEQKKAARVAKYEAMGYNGQQIEYILKGPADGKYDDERTKLCWFGGNDRKREYHVHRISREMDILHGELANDGQPQVPLNTTACDAYPEQSQRLTKIYLKFRQLTDGSTWYDNY